MFLLLLQLTCAAQAAHKDLVGDCSLDLDTRTPGLNISGEPIHTLCTLDKLTQECSANEISCDWGTDHNGCWLGNYCIDKGMGPCPEVIDIGDLNISGDPVDPSCALMLTQECTANEISCDWGTDQNGCWLGNYCIDKGLGPCIDPGIPLDIADLNISGEPVDPSCTLIPTQECTANEISCDMGTDDKGCWLGNYCIESVDSLENIVGVKCPGVCSQSCNWETEEWCDAGFDSNFCWLGNWCQDISLGGCPVPAWLSELTSRGKDETSTALERKLGEGKRL